MSSTDAGGSVPYEKVTSIHAFDFCRAGGL